MRVQLVDGGVHDNQGVGTLLDAGCERVIVSDASGQMADMDEPSTRIPASVTRSTSGIYGDRVREEQLSDVRRQPGRSALIHLRKGLPALVVPPVPDDDPETTTTPVMRGAVAYDVAPRVQLMLSQVRTDLDSFSEVEAYSLAGYGYAMSSVELEVPGIKDLAAPDPDATVGSWAFTRVLDYLRRPPDPFLKQLAIAQKRFLKPVKLSLRAKLQAALAALVALVVVGGLVALVLYLLRDWLTSDIPTWGAVVAVLGFAARRRGVRRPLPEARVPLPLARRPLGVPLRPAQPGAAGAAAVDLRPLHAPPAQAVPEGGPDRRDRRRGRQGIRPRRRLNAARIRLATEQGGARE